MAARIKPVVQLLLIATAATSAHGQMFGSGGSSSFSSGGGFSSSSSSSSSSSGNGVSSSTISQSQAGGRVSMQCSSPPGSTVVWYKQEGGRRREIGRGTSSNEPRHRITADGYSNVMTIEPTKDSDSGAYECDSSAPDGGTSKHQFSLSIGRGRPGGATRNFAAAGVFMGTLLLLL